MSVNVMMGEQGREAFDRAVRNGPPPMSENERQAYRAQCYPQLPVIDVSHKVLERLNAKPPAAIEDRSGEQATSKDLS